MGRHDLGEVAIYVTPAALMKSELALTQWGFSSELVAQQQFRTYHGLVMGALAQLPDDTTRAAFIEAGLDAVQAAEAQLPDVSRTIGRFGARRVLELLDEQRWERAARLAAKYDGWIGRLVKGQNGRLARAALEQYARWGVAPLRPVIASAAAFGASLMGMYVPALRTVTVQLDVTYKALSPSLLFIETMLHEQFHVALHAQMGDDAERHELLWLEELAAILTSHHALFTVARQTGDVDLIDSVAEHLRESRTFNLYGTLASAVLRETRDSLMPWRAWQLICALPPAERRNYATAAVLTPLLHRAGWNVRFPYHFGSYWVNCAG